MRKFFRKEGTVVQNIKFTIEGGVCTITLTRPNQLNAINMSMLKELKEFTEKLKTDGSVGCVIITGQGEKAFAAGADIGEMKDMTQNEAKKFSRLGSAVMRSIEKLEIPVIAAVNGYALGGGCELTLCCDIRIAAENAVFGQPEVTLGIIPGFGGTQRLSRVVGQSRAKEMIFTGKNINAEEALRAGLVSRVVPEGGALAAAEELAKTIIKNPANTVRSCKNAVEKSTRCDIDIGLAFESEIFAGCFTGEDQKSRMTAFLNKRKK